MSTHWQELTRLESTTAAAVIAIVYSLRVVAIATPTATPWPLSLTTDLLLPAMAGSWLFVATIYVAITTYDHRH